MDVCLLVVIRFISDAKLRMVESLGLMGGNQKLSLGVKSNNWQFSRWLWLAFQCPIG